MNRTLKIMGSHHVLAGLLLVVGLASIGCSAPVPTEERRSTSSKFGRVGPAVGEMVGRTWGNSRAPGRAPLPRTPEGQSQGEGTPAQEACKGSAENCAEPDGSRDNPYPYDPNRADNQQPNDGDYAEGYGDGQDYGDEQGWDAADIGGGGFDDCGDCG